ncbi:MAG: hypothetical protein JSU72_17800, partial [Deltaproteobacteria bacterium]
MIGPKKGGRHGWPVRAIRKEARGGTARSSNTKSCNGCSAEIHFPWTFSGRIVRLLRVEHFQKWVSLIVDQQEIETEKERTMATTPQHCPGWESFKDLKSFV